MLLADSIPPSSSLESETKPGQLFNSGSVEMVFCLVAVFT